MRYRVNWNYRSSLAGPWSEGQLVEMTEALAAAVDATSPGVLTPEPEDQHPDQEGAQSPAKGERQVKAARNRAVTEPETDR